MSQQGINSERVLTWSLRHSITLPSIEKGSQRVLRISSM